MPRTEAPTATHLLHLGILLMLALLFLFVGLGSMGLTDRDEGRNAEAGREMLESGDWISPTFNYEPRYAKPALVYWLMSLSYQAFGVNEFSARFPSALFGTLLILLQYLFMARFCGAATALFGSLMLLLNIEIIGLSRMALTDAVLIFWTTFSLFSFWLGFHGASHERWWRWLFYVGMAVATLAKGPVGFLVPLVTVAAFLTMTKQWGRFLREGSPLPGTLLFVAVALPWYAAMWQIHGSDYAASAQANTVGRFFAPMEGHSFTILFYIPVLLLGFFPWSGWLLFAWMRTVREWRTWWRTHLDASLDETARLEWFAAAWVMAVMVFFTLSSTRLPHYIGPLFPAAAILTAGYWSRGLQEPALKGSRAAIHTTMALGYLLAIGFAALPSVYPSFAGKLVKEFPLATQMSWGNGPYLASILLLIGMALVGYLGLNEQRRAGAFWAAGASVALLVLIVLQLIAPGFNRYFISPSQELAYAAGLNLDPKDRLIAFGSTRPSLAFYAKRKVIFIGGNDLDLLKSQLAQPGRVMILLPETFKTSLPAEAQSFQPILTRFGYQLLSNQSMVTIPEGAAAPPTTRLPGH